MTPIPWGRTSREHQLSEYLDGELDPQQIDAVAECLTLDPDTRSTLHTLQRVDELAGRAMRADAQPVLEAAVQRILAATGTRAPAAVPALAGAPRKRLRTALLASAGLLVTAGVAFVGLRRRGLV